jgi:hypothetical protein
MSPGGAAGNLGAGNGGPAGAAPAGRLDQPGSAAAPSDRTSGMPDDAGTKGSAAGSPSASDNAGKEPKGMAEDQPDREGGAKDGKPADRSATDSQPDNKDGMKKDGKPADRSAAESQPDTKGSMPEDRKSGAAAEGKDDAKAKAGKSVRLESKDVSKVKSHFSQNKPNAKRVDKDDVSVSIGIGLPPAIVLYDLPAGVIVVSGPCPVQYFVWGDDIVLVDSCTREVVEIIAGVA